MPETESSSGLVRWKRLTGGIGAKVIGSLLAVMVVTFSLLGYLNIRLHRHDLEAARLASAERVSDVIKRSTVYYMLRNDRDGLYRTIQTMAGEPGTVGVRILDPMGRIHYSTNPEEINRSLNAIAADCGGCSDAVQPLGPVTLPAHLRIYRSASGTRVLGIMSPIENQPGCSNAACHAHPAGQKVLGVLDTNLSLAQADAQVTASSTLILAYTAAAVLLVAVLSWLFVWRVVHKPIQALKKGTEHLSRGDLGYQIKLQSQDEVGELAASFNDMSTQLRAANEQITTWARTLEDRVEQKTMELRNAHDHVLHVEKMASVGKMAAVVAHEVNNPLSGILTYAKLLRRWVGSGESNGAKRDEALQCLDLIANESRRCGELIKNLLSLSRTAPMNVQTTDLHDVIERCLLLVRHQLELVEVEWQLDLDKNLPLVECDPAQIEQVVLALIMNAIDAMPHGGTLWLSARLNHGPDEVAIQVRDNGSGISPEVLPQIFEPFVTTKESGRGVGLGLAISRGIVERHGGRIEVKSEMGLGTTFTVSLPAHGHQAELAVAGIPMTRVKKANQ
jgi:two-component system, NtrC family, sensor kinase